jgi:hypothetical protein
MLVPYYRNGGMIGVTLDFASEETYGGAGGSGTVLTYLGNYDSENPAQDPVTYTGVDFGTEAADRYIIVALGTRNDSRTFTGVTIGGISATIIIQQQSGNSTAGIAIAAVPTGTSGDVVVNLSGTADSHYLGVWSATGLASATPVDSAGVSGNGSDAGLNTFNLNTDANGFAILTNCNAAGGNGPEDPGAVSANLTLRYDGVTTTPLHTIGGAAGADGLTDGTTTSFGINVGDTNNNDAAVAVTFAGTTGGPPSNKKNSGIWDVASVIDSIIVGGSTPTYEVGFTPSLLTISGENNAWTQQTVDISAYAGATVRLVFRYQNGNGFNGDIQLDLIDLDGTTYSFENQTHSFETSTNNNGSYDLTNWTAIAVEEDNRGAWQVDQNGTPSGSTGRTDAQDGSYYVYFEASSPANVSGYNGWLRSPEITLSGSPTLTFYEARLGADIGSLDVHLDVIS